MIEDTFVTRVEVQQEPEWNLFPNTNAAVDLTGATATNANVFRDDGVAFNPGYDTAFELVGSASNASWMNIGGDTGAIRLNLVPGQTYTVRATARLGGALAGAAGTFARQIVAYTRIGTGSYSTVASSRISNAAGTADLSLEFTVPVNASEAFIRFFHGHPEAGSTIWWYKLRISAGTIATTGTGFWDGDTYDGPYFTDDEYGWDSTPGKSVSWHVDRSDNTVLDEAVLELSYDVRRVPYIQGTVTCPLPDGATLLLLDPRRSFSPIINWNMARFGRTAPGPVDDYLSSAPVAYPADVAGKLWVRTRVIDYVNQTLTLDVASGEVLTEDKRNIAGGAYDTNAPDVEDLVRFAVGDAGGTVVYVDSAASAAAVTGDRQLWLAGETLANLYEAELAALDLRLFMDETGVFEVRPFTQPPTYDPVPIDLEDGAANPDGTIQSFRSSIDREDWRDATVIRADYIDGAGTRQTAWQYYPLNGVNRKGGITNLQRAIPSSSYAQNVTERAILRSDRVEITMNCDFDYHPGRDIVCYLDGNSFNVSPEVVTYRPDQGTMTIVGYRA
jgi:hypothetical protein